MKNMKHRCGLLLAALMTGALCLPAQAGPVKDSQKHRELVSEAPKLLAHIGIANIALAHEMFEDAEKHLAQGLPLARSLEQKTERLEASERVKTGKLTYKSKRRETNYWLPLVDEKFIVRTLDEKVMKSKIKDVEVADARMVRRLVFLDTKQVREDLEKASTALKSRDYGDAELALERAAASTFTDEIIIDEPLETARDNLILARELMRDRNYGTAKLALEHAVRDLLRFLETNPAHKSEKAVRSIQAQVVQLKTEIEKKDPSLLTEAKQKLEKWIAELKSAL